MTSLAMAPELRKIIDITRRHDAKLAEEELLEESRRVPELEPPRCGAWPVLVLRTGHAGHVWVRIINPQSDAAFRRLMSCLEEFYGQRALGQPVCRPRLGQVVAAPLRGFWCRAALVRMRAGCARLASVDEATTAYLPLDALRLLEPRFAELPRQAFRCRLEEVGASGTGWLLQRLEARRLTAEFRGGGWPGPPTARLELEVAAAGDGRGGFCRRLWGAGALQQHRPRLPPEGDTAVARVSHVSRGGDLFVRMRGDCVPALEAALRRAVALAQAEDVGMQHVTPLHLLADPGRVVLAPAAGWLWHRAAVAKYAPYSTQVVVRLIDHGTKKALPVSELIIVDTVDELINNLPPQALRVRLVGVQTPLSGGEASLLRRITSRHMVALQAAGVSRRRRMVELFVRRGPTHTSLCSLSLLLRNAQEGGGCCNRALVPCVV